MKSTQTSEPSNQTSFILKANVEQVIHSVPQTAMLKEAPRQVKKYRKSLFNLPGKFHHRFSDFGKIDKSHQLVSCPFTQDPEMVPQALQMELKDLQWDIVLKFNSFKLDEFYASLSAAKFPNIQKVAGGCWCCLALRVCKDF